ncbi:MAG: ABC transporter substrate-binding protein [Hyphomicrobiaceae bacterium]|nr:ABC transporter substrate-binding protein [Hyphomicrobiaceae bacterium]
MKFKAWATGALAALAMATSAHAADEIVIGLTGALTGPPSSTYAPAVDALRVYLDRVNAAGGIDSRKVKLILEDDGAQPSKAAANAKKLLDQDKAVLLINASLSSTYAPVVAEAKRAETPILFASSVCPKETYPPADPLQFCTTAFAANYDSRATLAFIKETAKGPVKLGLAAMAIPVSRGEIDYAEGLAKEMGLTPVDKEIIPPPTADYTPFATKLQSAGANWVYSWAPWVTQIKTFEALRRLDWKGRYISWAHLEAEGELARVKDPDFYVVSANAMFRDDLPIHKEIRDAAAKAGLKHPAEQMAEGWIAGMAIEGILKGAGPSATPAKVQASMQNLKVDLKGLRGGPLEWSKENHFRTKQYYKVYKWDAASSKIVQVKDWTAFEVK